MLRAARSPVSEAKTDFGAIWSDVEGDGVERVASSGSCVRCGRALGLASALVDGRWYGNAACAGEGPCALDQRPAAVPEDRLYSRPRRHFRRRLPKELRTARERRG